MSQYMSELNRLRARKEALLSSQGLSSRDEQPPVPQNPNDLIFLEKLEGPATGTLQTSQGAYSFENTS